jgi:tetratricopeptide (TPR) repeat protein
VLDTALDYAQNAVRLDPTDARGFGELGFVHLWRKEHDASISAYKRGLSLNPNDADLMSELADALAFSGRSEEAVELLGRAMRLNPFYPDEYLWNLAGAYYNIKDYEKAIETALKMNNPTEGQRVLAASYAQLGRM